MAIYYGDGSNSTLGRLIQVHTAFKTDTASFSASTGSFSDISGLSITLTPKSSTSMFFINVNTNYSTATGQRGTFRVLKSVGGGGYGLIANSVGDAAGSVQRGMFPSMAPADNNSRSVPCSMTIRDDPNTTSQIIYKLQGTAESSAGTVYINRTAGDNSATTYQSGMSSMIIYEVAHA